jgi:hypothetical protein
MTSRVFRRLERLELRASAVGGIKSIPIRVLLVDADRGLTGVLLLDGANPTMFVPPRRRKKGREQVDVASRFFGRKSPYNERMER